jgi:hypothetical protein
LASTVEPDDGPVLPSTLSLERRSSIPLILFVQKAQVLISRLTLPIQPNLRGSNLARSGSSRGSVVLTGLIMAMTVPSRGATLAMYPVAVRLPAPGMFWTIKAGVPGICCGRNRATVRA